MKISIRVDASIQIGTGHVIRCLNLADALHRRGVDIQFISRDHPGNLGKMIAQKGYSITLLPSVQKAGEIPSIQNNYATWLGAPQEEDALQTIGSLQPEKPDWLIIDHYGINVQWENMLRPYVKGIMVIDGLADRLHDCDILLDQTYTAAGESRWTGLVPDSCRLFVGPRYALLNSEFLAHRAEMPQRDGTIRRIFIAFGGTDQANNTEKALKAVLGLGMNRQNVHVDVVIGASNPYYSVIHDQYKNEANVKIYYQTSRIAELMAKADLAIGAGGTMMWERCFLGLPTLVIVLSDNQKSSTEAVNKFGAIVNLGLDEYVSVRDIRESLTILLNNPEQVKKISQRSYELFDNENRLGTEILCDAIMEHSAK